MGDLQFNQEALSGAAITMSNTKAAETREIKGWDTTIEQGKGVKLRFLYPTTVANKFEEGPWVTLSAARCRALAEELLEESKKL